MGLSLLQLLAQSADASGPGASSADTATSAAPDKSTDSSKDASGNAANDNANALALAAFTQALAAALAGSAAAPSAAPLQPTRNAAPTPTDGTTAVLTDAAQAQNGSPNGASNEPLNGSDADAPKSDLAAAKSFPVDTSTADTAAAGSNSLAHLGVTSHFQLQHTHNDTNTGELKLALGSEAWNDELGGQLTWMTQQGLESGSLRVSPEHLGPVEVQISVHNGDASVWFGASHPDTRAALEQALPRLREMFASQGLTLTDSGVSRESPRNQGKPPSPRNVAAVSAVSSPDTVTSSAVHMSLGLIDTYA